MLWVGRDAAVAVTGRGICRWSGATWEIYRFPHAERGPHEPATPSLSVVFGDGGTRCLVQRPNALVLWRSGSSDVTPVEAPPLDALTALGDQLIVSHRVTNRDGRQYAALATAALDGARLVLGAPLSWPSPARLPWPGGIWTPGSEPEWGEDAPDRRQPFEPSALAATENGRFGDDPFGGIRLRANRYGLVASGLYSGLVVGFDAALQPRFAVRLQVRDQSEIHAVPTEHGVLIVIVESARHSALSLIGWDGALLGHTHHIGSDHAWSVTEPMIVGRDTAVVMSTDKGEEVLFELDLPSLRSRRSHLANDHILVAHASALDRDRHLLALGSDPETPPHRLEWTLAEAGRPRRLTAIPAPDLRPIEVPSPRSRAVDGKPLPSVRARSAWAGRLGEVVEFDLDVSNGGGSVDRIGIEVSVRAEAHHVRPLEAIIGADNAAFSHGPVYRAEISGVMAPAIIDTTSSELQPSTSHVRLRFQAVSVGQSLVEIRVVLHQGRDSATALQGRTFSVS